MPSKTPKQRRFMAAVANNPEFAKKAGVPQSVGREFHNADKREGYFMGGFTGLSAPAIQAAMERYQQQQGGLPNYQIGIPSTQQVGNYFVPAPSTRTGLDFDDDSIAAEIYRKYGIVDPTATSYDRTSQAKLKEDPYAHMAPTDPARQQYERWDLQRGSGYTPPTPRASGSREDSPYRQQLREHKAKIEDILGSAEGGPVGYRRGGLAEAMRGAMGRAKAMGMRNMNRNRRLPNKRTQMRVDPSVLRQWNMRPHMMPGRQMIRKPQPMRMAPPNPEMLDAARMPGGAAAPMRGLLQKLRSGQMKQGNRIGMRDQQGGLSRAMQTQTGRPPISRRAAFPGSRQNQY